jgi:threonyl-tRNA synthetase
MTPENMHEEVVGVLRFMRQVLKRFGFSEFDIFLSTRPEKYVGSLENWQTATSTLEKALQAEQVEYQVDPGEGVFYGPKIDIKIRDSLKRSWQCSTIQVDFNLPQRFGMEFVDRDGQRKQPIMVHRALLGSIERFFGVLLEHYAGALPFWFSPEQIRVLTLSNDQHVYGKKLADQLTALGYRATVDIRNEKLGYKIREAQTQKIPIMAVIGEKEASVSQVSVRMRDGTPHNGLSWEGFIELLKKQENE